MVLPAYVLPHRCKTVAAVSHNHPIMFKAERRWKTTAPSISCIKKASTSRTSSADVCPCLTGRNCAPQTPRSRPAGEESILLSNRFNGRATKEKVLGITVESTNQQCLLYLGLKLYAFIIETNSKNKFKNHVSLQPLTSIYKPIFYL